MGRSCQNRFCRHFRDGYWIFVFFHSDCLGMGCCGRFGKFGGDRRSFPRGRGFFQLPARHTAAPSGLGRLGRLALHSLGVFGFVRKGRFTGRIRTCFYFRDFFRLCCGNRHFALRSRLRGVFLRRIRFGRGLFFQRHRLRHGPQRHVQRRPFYCRGRCFGRRGNRRNPITGLGFSQRRAALQILGYTQRILFHRALGFGNIFRRGTFLNCFFGGRSFHRALPEGLKGRLGRRCGLNFLHRPKARRSKRLWLHRRNGCVHRTERLERRKGDRLRSRRFGRGRRTHDGGLIKRRAAVQLTRAHHHRLVSRMASLRHRPRQAFVQRDRLKRIVLFPTLIFHESSSFLPIIQ